MNVAVVDVGKTNKKVHVYNEKLELIDTRSRSFDSVETDGMLVIPSQAIEEWLFESLGDLAQRHEIGLISVTTHGATIAAVDEAGDLAIPIPDYTFEPGDEFHEQFYELVGSPDELQRRTASLPLSSLLNLAQTIYFFQTRYPDEWKRVAHLLLYPQYLSFRLTGVPASDATYAACHAFLYDFDANGFGFVVDKLGVRDLLPAPIRAPGEVLGRIDAELAGRTGILPTTLVTLGIHDSNSSLLPYLIQKPGEDFIVNSTGTWCVAMHPEERVELRAEEIGKAVFYNMSALGNPVKTSILMGGLEFDTYTTLIRERAGMGSLPEVPASLYEEVASAATEFILPAVVRGTGQFPDSEARIVTSDGVFPLADMQGGGTLPALLNDYPRALAVLNLSLAIQTITALERVGLREGVTVYTEGGFRNNPDYNALLASLARDSRFLLSGMPEATSFGAALLGFAALQDREPGELASFFSIVEEEVSRLEVPSLAAYAREFHRQLAAE